MASETVALPIRISKVTDRYLVFDIDDIMYLRRHHNICSPFVGTMPQAPSQSVFMGLPVELMVEEAMVLVGKKAAYVVDDSVFHPSRIPSLDPTSRAAYLQAIKTDGTRAATAARELREYKQSQALSKGKGKNKKDRKAKRDSSAAENSSLPNRDTSSVAGEPTLFDAPDRNAPKAKPQSSAVEPYAITPVTSGALLTPPPEEDTLALIDVPRGYALYAHLHNKGYFMMPGLRFGCDYNVYPGDPLRYHSHFQATHYGWREQIKLLDLVTGGRLGTNVKKAYLIGGEIPAGQSQAGEAPSREDLAVNRKSKVIPPVRAFSIEWAAM